MSSHAYSQIYLHITFHTKDNARVIQGKLEERLHEYLRSRASETRGIEVHAVGGMEDHVHMAVRIPPTLLISDWIGQMKGASSFHINQRMKRKLLHWQDGYGVVSLGKRALPEVVDYIQMQREHHTRGSVHAGLECISEEDTPLQGKTATASSKPGEPG